MSIAVQCPCGQKLSAKGESRGKRVRCPGCGGILTVPDVAVAEANKQPEPHSSIAESEAKTTSLVAKNSPFRWYQLRFWPTVVFTATGILLLVLQFVPRTIDDLGEVYPGAGVKPIVKEFGFPLRAVSWVSTAQTNERGAAPVFRGKPPTSVTITFVSPGPKLRWLASTQAVTFEDGFRTHVAYAYLVFDIALFIVLMLVAFALCKWWTNRTMRAPSRI